MPYGPQHPDDPALRRRVRQKLRSRSLPGTVPAQLYAGHGEGQLCSLCAEAIGAGQVMYEVETARGRTLYFHLACHAAWHLETGAR